MQPLAPELVDPVESVSEVPSMVPPTDGEGIVTTLTFCEPPQFSSDSDVPVSLLLPGYFYAFGPWRPPKEQMTDRYIFLSRSRLRGRLFFWGCMHLADGVILRRDIA